MKPTFRRARILLFCGMMLFALIPGKALAHDNLGGDELSMSGAMLIGAIIVTAMALLAGIWAWQAGQFNNTEESKYTMLETAENYDAIMAEADRLVEAERNAALEPSKPSGHTAPPTPVEPAVSASGRADKAAQA